ncbi:MAG: hypothetical protein JWN60_1049 [Acidobacteria bacterium]|jgi:hypothetical protein|nr:hypothetical protein [Acidobacteriota bacterium]
MHIRLIYRNIALTENYTCPISEKRIFFTKNRSSSLIKTKNCFQLLNSRKLSNLNTGNARSFNQARLVHVTQTDHLV